MPDDTLSPVGFESRIVKTHLDAQERFALGCMLKDYAGTQAGLVRDVVMRGIEDRGWTEERRIREYAEYRLHCLHRGIDNKYESE